MSTILEIARDERFSNEFLGQVVRARLIETHRRGAARLRSLLPDREGES